MRDLISGAGRARLGAGIGDNPMSILSNETQTPFIHDDARGNTPETRLRLDPIRIYVACLAAYNSGHLHGSWIEVTDEAAIDRSLVRDLYPATV